MKKKFSRVSAVVAAVAAATLIAATPALAAATVSSTTLVTGLYSTSSAYNPAGDTVAVAAFGQSNINFPPVVASEVDFIDVKTNTVTVVQDDAITAAANVVWSPDGTLVYVLNNDGGIAVIDVATYTVIDSLSSGDSTSAWGMSISPDGNYLVVGDYTEDNLGAIINIADNTYVTLSYDASYGVATFVSPDGSLAYVVDYYGEVDVFDMTDPSYVQVDTLQFADMSYGGTSVCSSFDMSTLYMVDYNEAPFDAYLSRLDLASGDSVSTATSAGESIGCNMTPDGKHLLVASYGGDVTGSVLEFDATTLEYVTEYSTSATDYSDVIASSPKTCDVYVSNYEPTTNILNFTCTLPDTGVDTAAIAAGAAFAVLAVGAGTFMLIVRRRKS